MVESAGPESGGESGSPGTGPDSVGCARSATTWGCLHASSPPLPPVPLLLLQGIVPCVTDWNLADVYEQVADVVPDRPAQICGSRTVLWRDFDRRANALAADLIAAGLGRQSKVAVYQYNGVEYLEAYLAAFKAALVPVNTNYRYGPAELAYLFDNADAEAVVFSASFAPVLEQIRDRLPTVKRWYAVDDGVDVPSWAVPYESVVAAGADRAAPPWGRSGDDLLLLYTGGTTGMPKGVM
jgi:3-oxocholest-4-en-26-oate---CoA ligase